MNVETQKTCAILSAIAYETNENDLPFAVTGSYNGFQRIETVSDESGLYAEAWRSETNEIIVAFRGTEFSSLADWFQGNVPLGQGSPTANQWVSAQSFIETIINTYPGDSITFTGHSLGGGLASLASIMYDAPAYAFAPAPFKNTADHWRFIPKGIDSEAQRILTDAIAAYDNEYAWAVVNNVPNPEAWAINARDSIPGYGEAETIRQNTVNERCGGIGDQISVFTVEGEVLTEFFMDPSKMDELGAHLGYGSGWLNFAAETFPIEPGEICSIGGIDDVSLLESISRHGMALHALVLHTDFEDVLASNTSLRNAMLSGVIAPYATNSDGSAADQDISILYRALLQSPSFYNDFNFAFEKLSSDQLNIDSAIKNGLTMIGLQKAIIYTNYYRAGDNPFFFMPFTSWTSYTVTINMADVDDFGILDANGIAVGRSTINEAFLNVLEENFLQLGYSEVGANWAANAVLGRNVLEGEGELLLGWENLVVANNLGSATIDSSLAPSMILGSVHSDEIIGSSYVDYISGGNGDDLIEGKGGADIIVGGSHNSNGDTASYVSSESGISINLALMEAQSGGDADGDILIGVENVIGTSYADHFRGSREINYFAGGDEYDYFYVEGDGTNSNGDTYDGGFFWNDLIDFSGAFDLGAIQGEADDSLRFKIDLGLGYALAGSNFWLNILNIEDVVGSDYSDVVYGNLGTNFLIGGNGDDTFFFSVGGDTIYGSGFQTDYSDSDTINLSTLTDGPRYNNYIEIILNDANGWGRISGYDPYYEQTVLHSIENVTGSRFNDWIEGTSGSNVLRGGEGDDYILSNGGADNLYGGNGNDFLQVSPGVILADGGVGDDWVGLEGDWWDWTFELRPNGANESSLYGRNKSQSSWTEFRDIEQFSFDGGTVTYNQLLSDKLVGVSNTFPELGVLENPTAILYDGTTYTQQYGYERLLATFEVQLVPYDGLSVVSITISGSTYQASNFGWSDINYHANIDVSLTSSAVVDYEEYHYQLQEAYTQVVSYGQSNGMNFQEWMSSAEDGVFDAGHEIALSHLGEQYKYTMNIKLSDGTELSRQMVLNNIIPYTEYDYMPILKSVYTGGLLYPFYHTYEHVGEDEDNQFYGVPSYQHEADHPNVPYRREDFYGGGGTNVYYGGDGVDHIYTGLDEDIVYFMTGDGIDRVFGFDSAKDKIVLDSYFDVEFSQATYLEDQALKITYDTDGDSSGDGDSILLIGVTWIPSEAVEYI